MFKIHNFRAGFATNSSSSHSVVLLSPDMVKMPTPRDSYSDYSFGWDEFCLTTEEQKLRYLAAQLFSNFGNNSAWSDQDKADLVQQMYECGIDFGHFLGKDIWDAGVDHQSVLSLPSKYDRDTVASLIQFFSSKNVVVFGGNDNTERSYYNPADIGTPVDFMVETETKMRMRRDENYWVVMNGWSGDKLRFSFEDDLTVLKEYEKASAPELVDLKITDWCAKNCSFCYQGSTERGQHAPLERLEKIIATLEKMSVFEVAIGGGEPTAHQHFATILRMIHDANMVPNFTTYTDAWLENEEILNAVNGTVGGIGVSCLSSKDFDLYRNIKAKVSYNAKVMVQHVVGSVPVSVTSNLLDQVFSEGPRWRSVPLLLLGYKEVGFGATYERHDDKHFGTILKLALAKRPRDNGSSVSIDTALLDRYPNLPDILGAPKALVSSPEGKFSCYVDAVEDTMAASSYVQKSETTPMSYGAEAFKKVFATF